MKLTQQLVAVLLVMFGAGCADDMPVTTHYAPADCPPTTAQAEAAPPPTDHDNAEIAPEPKEDLDHEDEEPATAGSAKVNVNTASALDLTSLPGVGPALAARIIAYRDKRAFEKPEDLLRVRGIGPAKFAKMQGVVEVGSERQKRSP